MWSLRWSLERVTKTFEERFPSALSGRSGLLELREDSRLLGLGQQSGVREARENFQPRLRIIKIARLDGEGGYLPKISNTFSAFSFLFREKMNNSYFSECTMHKCYVFVIV